MALTHGNVTAMSWPGAPSRTVAVHGLRQLDRPIQRNVAGRRSLLSFLVLSTATMSDSKTSLLQEYQRRSQENKEKNDKERLDDYYKRNYKDYFEFVEGSSQDKNDEQLSEAEKGIREWLKKNRK